MLKRRSGLDHYAIMRENHHPFGHLSFDPRAEPERMCASLTRRRPMP
jgi:hypothetical protein